jgi:methylamine--corrinoid protein Co-methyltransferase
MEREQANELVQRLYEHYKAELDNKPTGKPFEEVYDIESVQPRPEWKATYEKIWAKLVEMGLPLDRLL